MLINYPVEGEILKVQTRALLGESNIIRYLCRATLADGSQILLPNVEASTAFGGIADYFNMRHRASLEADGADSIPLDNQSELDAMVGDRCIIVFIHGSIHKPRIVAFKQHPNQTPELTSPETLDPQAVFQLMGVRCEFNEKGEFRIIRKGAPEVSYDPQNSIALDADILGKASKIKAKIGGNSIGGDNNAQIEPADQSEIALIEFLEKGVARLRDSKGQSIEFNPDKGTLFLSNDYYPSYLATDSTEAALIDGKKGEYIEFDKLGGALTIQSSRSTVIKNILNFEQTTGGSHDESVTGPYSLSVTAGMTVDAGQVEFTSKGNFNIDATLGVKVDSKGDIVFKDIAGATIKISKGQVAIGSPACELIDLLVEVLTTLSTTTAAGFGAPISSVAQFAQLAVKLATIKGSL
jgi:hypothetical protein